MTMLGPLPTLPLSPALTLAPCAPAVPGPPEDATSIARHRRRVLPPGRLLDAGAASLAAHVDLLEAIPWPGSGELLVGAVRAAGLRGRGGAGFPTAVKLEAVAGGRRAVVIANGAEGEPASGKDRHLMLVAPHLVLDGLQLAAHAVGARDVWCYVPPGPAFDAMRAALAERTGYDRYAVRMLAATGGFVGGQETAVVAAVEGHAPLPRHAPRRISASGVHGRPTLVQNVETLAHLAMIARFGPAWFRLVGTDTEPGTFLASVHAQGAGARTVEVAHGTPLRDVLLTAMSADAVEHVRAVLVGGYHGSWLSMPESADRPMSRAGVGTLGAGVVVPLPVDECALAATSRIVTYLAAESAGQCGPCMFGLPHLAHQVDLLARGRLRPPALDAVHRAAGLVAGRGACHHPDGTAALVASALTTFSRDVDAHLHATCIMSQRIPA